MFKRKLKIKQLVMSNSETFWYICGLGNDGKVYLWDKFTGKWVLNFQTPTAEQLAQMEQGNGKKA